MHLFDGEKAFAFLFVELLNSARRVLRCPLVFYAVVEDCRQHTQNAVRLIRRRPERRVQCRTVAPPYCSEAAGAKVRADDLVDHALVVVQTRRPLPALRILHVCRSQGGKRRLSTALVALLHGVVAALNSAAQLQRLNARRRGREFRVLADGIPALASVNTVVENEAHNASGGDLPAETGQL